MSYAPEPLYSYGDFNNINDAFYWASEWEKQKFLQPCTKWGMEAFRENVPPYFGEDMGTRRCPYDASFCSEINPRAPKGCGPIRRLEMPGVRYAGTSPAPGCEQGCNTGGCPATTCCPNRPENPYSFWDPVPSMASSVFLNSEGVSWPILALIAAAALILGYLLGARS